MKTHDPVTKLAKRLRDIGCKACTEIAGPPGPGEPRRKPWRKLPPGQLAGWLAVASHVLTRYARLTPDARRLLRRVQGKK